MKRATMLLLAGWTAVAGAQVAPEVAPAPPSEPVHTIDSDLTIAGVREVRIDLGIGDVAVRGEEIDRIQARLLVYCEKKPGDLESCEPHARELAVRGASDGERVRVGVEGVSKAISRRLRLRLEVRVPRELALEVHVRDGQVRVDDVLADTRVEVQKGTVDLRLPEAELAQLDVRAGGEASVERGDDLVAAKGTLSGGLVWTRRGGRLEITATSRLGDVRVVLD